MDTPIAFIVFNRPDLTRRTFERIREQRPSILFVIADGPHAEVPTDVERCAEVRDIVSQVDWPCEVHYDWAEANLGLKARVSSGIDWVFTQTDRTIILEDDCVPHEDFFGFCEALLDRYESDERVFGITGSNFQDGHIRGTGSYYFSRFNPLWGWATWKRAWEPFDVDMGFWSDWHDSGGFDKTFPQLEEREYWDEQFESARDGRVDSWGYPWIAFNLYSGGLTATPNANLISNVGFGQDSTHLKGQTRAGFRPVSDLGPLIHPESVEPDTEADWYLYEHRFGGAVRRRRQSLGGTIAWAIGGVGRRTQRTWRRWRSGTG